MNLLVTGATGFVGQRYTAISKNLHNLKCVSLQTTSTEKIDFTGVNTVLHLAGMAHQMHKIDSKIYFDVNFELTKKLADAAKRSGVTHFVFVSTIKVFGEHQNSILNEQTHCNPADDPYGESKLQAERYLQSIETPEFVVSIVRPPLIYGPAVKGNLIRFLKLSEKKIPLPFGDINNRRSMVFLDNLVAFINEVIQKRISGVFLPTDDHPISTTYLITEMRKQLGNTTPVFTIPSSIRAVIKHVKPDFYSRLFGSLEIDGTASSDLLSFTPPYSVQQGISEMVKWYKQSKHLNK